jgi:exonuclease SbcC
MNNQSIKFISTTIQNFRGIPDKLVIPLDAALTIIHAANGTGKSTICHALEWLLTGKVLDLVNTVDFSCQWGKGVTSVSASCLIGEKSYELTRTKSSLQMSIGEGKKTKIKETDLLHLLTPKSVSGKSSQAISKAKRSWLRNSRWLYSNSLSLLLDNNKAEERQQIFADILGLGHVTSTLRDLRDYRNQLPSIKGVEGNLERLSHDISELESKLDESTPWIARAEINIAKVFEEFPSLTPTGSREGDFKQAQHQIKIFEQKIEHDKGVIRYLSGQWDQYSRELEQLTSLSHTLKALSQTSLGYSTEHTKLSAEQSEAEVKEAEGLRSVEWANNCLEGLTSWEELITLESINKYFVLEGVSKSSLKKDFVEYSWAANKQDSWLEALNYSIINFTTVVNLSQEKTYLLSNVIQQPVDIANVSRQAEEAKGVRVKSEAEFSTLSNVLDKLKVIGKEVINSQENGHCPLCSHDWKSSDKLLEQVNSEHLLTEEINNAANKLEKARKLESDSIISLSLANSQKAAYEAYTAKLIRVNNKLLSFEERTKYFEIMNFSDFSNFTNQNLIYLKERVKAVIDLRTIFDNLAKVEAVYKDTSSEKIKERISKACKNLDNHKDYYQKQADKAKSDKTINSPLIKGLIDKVTAKSIEINGLNSNIAAITQTVSSFEARWKEIIGDGSIELNVFNTFIEKVEQQAKLALSLTDILGTCEAVVGFDTDSDQLIKLKDEKEALSERFKAGNSRITEADETILSYSEHVKMLTTSSLEPLISPASELFSRMHANEVYKGLSVSEGEALKWTVFADGHDVALDAEEKFSQGQRQDLALSLYLARAMNTSGSFFLDEPIAHLDDLNRVAMLDILRLITTSMPNMNLILTTASESLARHLAQKFSSINDKHVLNMIYLEGNPRTGVTSSIKTNMVNS